MCTVTEKADVKAKMPEGLRKFQKVNEILAKYNHDATNRIAILQQVQHEYR